MVSSVWLSAAAARARREGDYTIACVDGGGECEKDPFAVIANCACTGM